MKSKQEKPSDCPVTTVAKLLSDTWTMLIIHNVLDETVLRFGELEKKLATISSRTLTLKLKQLETKGIIVKTQEGYRLSPKGKELRPIIRAMHTFGKK